MVVEYLSVDDLDYLQRTGAEPPQFSAGSRLTEAPVELRECLRVDGIGRLDKSQRVAPESQSKSSDNHEILSTDLLVGLYNYKIPLSFSVRSLGGRVSFSMGSWLPAGADPRSVEQNGLLLQSASQTLYPSINFSPEDTVPAEWELGGMALGIPTFKPPDALDGALPFDRLLRALRGTSWEALVLAQPIDEMSVRELRLRVINEMRSVQTSSKHESLPSPLAEHYLKLLEMELKRLTDGQGTGAWRTAVYLLGNADSYYRLTSVWRGIFSGKHSLPEPVRVWDRPEVPMLASTWAMFDPEVVESYPGHYRHPFQHQTLLSSAQLATYVHFPNFETHGFAITQVPDFDVVSPPVQANSIHVGDVVEGQNVLTSPYGVPLDRLSRHAFITGMTGSGKTNTIFHLLHQATEHNVPYLVLEPAKTEYRVLLRDIKVGKNLRVFTLGDETTSPFRLNPFEVPEGIPIAVHLDLLRSVFNVSFGMWTPLPQVLERALHEIYVDRGWDVTSNTNHRVDQESDRSQSFPTLTDLLRKVEEIVPQLGYEEEVTGDIQAALSTRLNSLRTGGKGRMLDVRRGLPLEALLGEPTILELEGIGDDEDKAFMMGLLMIRLAEFRRTQGDAEELRHLLVIEEAHRLLSNSGGGQRDEFEADAQGKAVETFTHLLTEVRAYGQGIIVADQVPAKLAPDVMKNTNLKLAHRVVAGDDRESLAEAMMMTPRQATSLATLPVGRAVLFAEGEDAPLLLQVPRTKGGSGTWPNNDEVRAHMVHNTSMGSHHFKASDDCAECCRMQPKSCELARRLTSDKTLMRVFRRMVFSAVQTREGMERTWSDVIAVVEPHRPIGIDRQALLACVVRHASRTMSDERGARASWTYQQTSAIAELIETAVISHNQNIETSDTIIALRRLLLTLQEDQFGPFPSCAFIWGDRPDPCLCRYPVAELISEGTLTEAWDEARQADRESEEVPPSAVWGLCQDAAFQTVEFPADNNTPELDEQVADVARCTALCFAQQMLTNEDWAHPQLQRLSILDFIKESGHEIRDKKL